MTKSNRNEASSKSRNPLFSLKLRVNQQIRRTNITYFARSHMCFQLFLPFFCMSLFNSCLQLTVELCGFFPSAANSFPFAGEEFESLVGVVHHPCILYVGFILHPFKKRR